MADTLEVALIPTSRKHVLWYDLISGSDVTTLVPRWSLHLDGREVGAIIPPHVEDHDAYEWFPDDLWHDGALSAEALGAVLSTAVCDTIESAVGTMNSYAAHQPGKVTVAGLSMRVTAGAGVVMRFQVEHPISQTDPTQDGDPSQWYGFWEPGKPRTLVQLQSAALC